MQEKIAYSLQKEFSFPLPIRKGWRLYGVWSGRIPSACSVSGSEDGRAVDLYYITSGEGSWRSGGASHPLSGGMALLTASDRTVELLPKDKSGFSFFRLRFESPEPAQGTQEDQLLGENLLRHRMTAVRIGMDMYSTFNALIGELRFEYVFRESMLEALFGEILIGYYRACVSDRSTEEAQEGSRVMEEAVRYIDRNALYLRNVSSLAGALGYSYSYLSHIFSETMGITLRDFFLQKRFEKAIELLRENMSIAEVSDMLGYASVHSFSRAFTRQIGCPPGSFRRAERVPARRMAARRVFDDFEGGADWEVDRVYGSMQALERVTYPRHSGTCSLAMEFNVTSDWRVDRYYRRREDWSGDGMTYFSCWVKSTSPVTVEIELIDGQWHTFSYKLEAGTVGAVVCIPLSEFEVKEEGTVPDLRHGLGIHFIFYGRNNTEKPSIGRLFVDDILFTDEDISMLTDSSTKNDLLDMRRPDTALVRPPVVVARPHDQTELNRLCQGKQRPVALQVILHADMSVYSVTGVPLGMLPGLFVKIYQRILPVFSVNDRETVDGLMRYLNEKNFQDVYILSSRPEVLLHVHEQYYNLRCILRVTEPIASAEQMRRLYNEHHIRILLLPEETDPAVLRELQDRQMTVWLEQTGGDGPLRLRYHRMLIGGAGGLLVDAPDTLYEAMRDYGGHTLLKTPYIIAYGYGQDYPWDTLEAARASVEAGADAIALDLFLTKDRRLIAYPEREVNRYSGDLWGNIEDYTWEELRHIRYNQNQHLRHTEIHPALLDDFYREFADTRHRLFLVIYEDERRFADQVRELTRQMGMEDRVTYVIGGTSQIRYIRQTNPAATVLTRGLYEWECHMGFPEILTNTQLYMTDFSPRYDQSASLPDLCYNLWCRGVTTWPYYFDVPADFRRFFLNGIEGIFCNLAELCRGWMRSLSFRQQALTLREGEQRLLWCWEETYDGQQRQVPAGITVLEGPLRAEGNTLIAEGKGEGSVLLWYEQSMPLWYETPGAQTPSYRCYAHPVTVTVL